MQVVRLIAVGMVIIAGIASSAESKESGGGAPADSVISEAIENVLDWDPGVAAHYIDVHTQKGIVTVSGYVDNILSRDRVEELVSSIRGVRAISNRLDIRPVFSTDDHLRAAVDNALSFDPVTKALSIDVAVKNGFVTLTGAVGSYAEKMVTANVVKGVSGVVGIQNKLKINSVDTFTDKEIRKNVNERIALAIGTYADTIECTVRNGKVRLQGVVPTIRQHERVRNVTGEVPGVRNIDLSGLKVLGGVDKQRTADRPLSKTPDDQRIRLTIDDVFRYSPRLVPYVLEYMVDSGDVYLYGKVDNLMTKRVAQQRIASIAGVGEVVNEITVRPTKLREDWELEQNVVKVLKWDPYVERHAISVWVNNGMVHLYGTVDNDFEKAHAEEIVARVHGVAAIKNNLTKQDAPWPLRSDVEIKRAIRKRIQWNDRLSGQHLDISVADGIATLSGKIDKREEYLSLLNCAFSGGAKGVQMDVDVRNYNRYFRSRPRYYPYGYPYGRAFGFSIPF